MEEVLFDGKLYSKLINSGTNNLYNNISIVNNLNVFPIPDGDTGDNMFLTINGGSKVAFNNNATTLCDVSNNISSGMQMNARGNSGAILSRFFSGISNGFEGKDSVSIKEFCEALKIGVEMSYKAVLVPTEGTILTVAREATEYVNSRVNTYTTFTQLFEDFLYELKQSLNRTPELLQVLKEAGVVDSGGAGLVYIFEGMLSALNGNEITTDNPNLSLSSSSSEAIDYSKFTEDSKMEFAYCTEFLLRLQSSKVNVKEFDEKIIFDFLTSVGDSVVCFKTDSIIKAHVHTFTPGVVFNEVQKYGEFLTLKVENMNIQHENSIVENLYSPKTIRKKYGCVTVATGDGIINNFKELGVDYVIYGGQSMNPSTEDFIEAFKKTNADTIFVFPNNSNVFLTANLSKELYKDSDIRIINTKNIGEGYAAISMFDSAIDNPDELEEMINQSFEGVVTGLVSPCIRDSILNGVETHEGEFVGFLNKEIITCQKSSKETIIDLAKKLNAEDYGVMILITGKDTTTEELEEVHSFLSKQYRFLDIYTIEGGQDIYNYILVLE